MTREKMLKDRSTIWEDSPEYLRPLATLVDWASNEVNPSTFAKFLDITGYSEEDFGKRMADSWTGGYLEINYLADALKCYADSPSDVLDWVDEFLALEMDDV